MSVSARAAGLLAALWLAGCSGSSPVAPDAGADAGAGPADAGQVCHALDAGCGVQADCGEPADSVHVYECLGGRCQRQTGFEASCFADIALPQLEISLSGWGPNYQPKSFEIRAYYPQRVDGSALGCADVTGQAAYVDGGSALDADATLEVENVGSYPAVCTTQDQICNTFQVNVDLVPQSAPVLLVQAYSAQRSTGTELGEACIEGTSIAEDQTPPQTLSVTLTPN